MILMIVPAFPVLSHIDPPVFRTWVLGYLAPTGAGREDAAAHICGAPKHMEIGRYGCQYLLPSGYG